MNLVLSLKQFLSDLRRQKLRTIMTMFGIFWGTCSIVLLLAFGKGITAQQLKSQKGSARTSSSSGGDNLEGVRRSAERSPDSAG